MAAISFDFAERPPEWLAVDEVAADRVRSRSMSQFGLRAALRTVVDVLADIARLGFLTLHSHTQLAAENLFLRKQLAVYIERQVKPRRADDATRIALGRVDAIGPGLSCW